MREEKGLEKLHSCPFKTANPMLTMHQCPMQHNQQSLLNLSMILKSLPQLSKQVSIQKLSMTQKISKASLSSSACMVHSSDCCKHLRSALYL